MKQPPDHVICKPEACEVREDGTCESCSIFKLLKEREELLNMAEAIVANLPDIVLDKLDPIWIDLQDTAARIRTGKPSSALTF